MSVKKVFGDYYLGLDIGTDSVGWAVTDLNYKLQKINGKDLWGIRLFDSGKTAKERRMFRSSRRRQKRKVQRIKLLQELFAEEIFKIDPGFYLRLNDSKYLLEDKTEVQKNTLFNDSNFKDKDYHKSYPTIFHLRKALLENSFSFDARLVYLALEHIIKNRGHFLFEGQSMDSISSFKNVFNDLNTYLRDELEIEFNDCNLNDVEIILKSKKDGINNKKKKIGVILQDDTSQKKAIIALLSGGTVSLKDLFNDESLDELDIKKITFSGSKYDDEHDKLESDLQERMYIIEKIKAIYNWSILADVLNNNEYISLAKVETYNKHNLDLKLLKKIVKENIPEKYSDVFSDSDQEANYCAYIGMNKKSNKKQVINKKICTQEDLCKYLEKLLKGNIADNENSNYLMEEILQRTLLPKQTSKNNSVIPYQVHQKELRSILKKASVYLPFLKNQEDGLSISDKIEKIFTFRIPYYVGPLNDAHKFIGELDDADKKVGNCWIVKKGTEKIRPWNFEKNVDLEASAENFIKRMTNKCTYLAGADVIPKDSLLYSEYMVLNELNNLKINNEKISVDLKKKIFTDLFMKFSHVTMKKLKMYLMNEGVTDKESELSGIDGDFKASLKSLIDLKNIFGSDAFSEKISEDLIKWIVLFGDDKKLLKSKIKNAYKISEEQLKNVLCLKYAGWGRFSKELLTEIYHVDKATGECISIISALRNTNENFMQLLSTKYNYKKDIDDYNARINDFCEKIDYKMVEDLYISPAVKRSVWQTLTIVEELVKIMGKNPKKVFVEVAREEGEKKRTISKKNKLIDLYKNCIDLERDWATELEKVSDSELRSDRLYLYYTQMGRCMYSNELISLNDLYNANIYDVDHIYPQSKVKDDSLENRVLVKKEVNAQKSDKYPIPAEYRQNKLWKILLEKNFIGKTKYDRLTRVSPFEDDELAGFILRQLVETRQSTKAVAELLSKVFIDTDIIYVKAGNVSEFRKNYEFIKVREINDYHHAKDAYLNIVVGNVYDAKFTKSPINFIKNSNGRDYNIRRMFDFNVERAGTIAWNSGENGTISQVKTTMSKNNILFTRFASEAKGGLFDQTLMKKGKGQLPIKSGDPKLCDTNKYGGYNKVAGAYFILVEHLEKKKLVRTIEFVPLHISKKIEINIDLLLEYCISDLLLINPKILLVKIKINTLFCVNGFYMHLSGRTGDQLTFKGAMQLVLNPKYEQYIKKIVKYIERTKISRQEILISEYDKIDTKSNKELYEILLHKIRNTNYKERMEATVITLETGAKKFNELNVETQCMQLYEILHLFQCNPTGTNLTLINGPQKAGLIKLSNNITFKNVKIINQSPTGIFSNEIDLLKL